MERVTIPKKEYDRLQSIAKAYTKLSKSLAKISSENTIDFIVRDFDETNLYSDEFLKDLKDGLTKSSYTKRKKDED